MIYPFLMKVLIDTNHLERNSVFVFIGVFTLLESKRAYLQFVRLGGVTVCTAVSYAGVTGFESRYQQKTWKDLHEDNFSVQSVAN